MYAAGLDGCIANLDEIILAPERAAINAASIVEIIVYAEATPRASVAAAVAAAAEEEEDAWAGALGAAGSACSMIVDVAVVSDCATFFA